MLGMLMSARKCSAFVITGVCILHPVSVARSETGWTNNEINCDWFRREFVPRALALRKTNDPVFLLLDGHDSHETDQLKEVAYAHAIIILAFPSKCTHMMQPLDVVVFGQTGRRWSDHCNRQVIEGNPIDRYNVIQEYCKIRKFMTPTLMQNAFRATGIYPVNRHVFKDHQFGPSTAFENTTAPPSSFPAEMLSSPVMAVATDTEMTDISDMETDDDLEIEPLNQNDKNAATIDTDFIPDNDNEPNPSTPTTPGPSHRVTRSASISLRSSSSAVSINAALTRLVECELGDNMNQEEMKMEFRRVLLQNRYLTQELTQAMAELQASNAHCTVMQRAASDAQTQLTNQRKKTRRSVKTDARFVTKADMQESFEKEKAEKEKAEQEAAAKEAEKEKEEAARAVRIREDTTSRQFTLSLSSYKKKEDLIILAGALGLPTVGTNPQLYMRIKSHLDGHRDLASNPRFAGLFNLRGRNVGPLSVQSEDGGAN